MVKILVVGDPHGKLPKGLSGIIKKNKIELIICTGEVPPVPFQVYYPKNMRKEFDPSYADSRYDSILRRLCSYALPVIILKGNAYMSVRGNKITRELFKKYDNLLYKRTGNFKFENQEFILFDMIWEKWACAHTEKKFFNYVTRQDKSRLKKINLLFEKSKNPILISHNPPYGYLDVVNNKYTGNKNRHVGSKVVLAVVKKYNPKLVFCGHIHEGKGKRKIGKTLVMNCGERGDYVVFDTDKNKILDSNFLK